MNTKEIAEISCAKISQALALLGAELDKASGRSDLIIKDLKAVESFLRDKCADSFYSDDELPWTRVESEKNIRGTLIWCSVAEILQVWDGIDEFKPLFECNFEIIKKAHIHMPYFLDSFSAKLSCNK